MFQLSKKQKKALQIVEYFIPTRLGKRYDWDNSHLRLTSYSMVGVHPQAQNNPKGISPEEAFFLKTERGKIAEQISDIPRFVSLLWGQRRMALTIKEWRQGFEEGYLYPVDFSNEYDYIQEIAKECCLAVGRKWNR